MELLSWSVCEAAALVKRKLNLRRVVREEVSWLLQPPPVTHAPDCHLPFQGLYYRYYMGRQLSNSGHTCTSGVWTM